MTHTFSCPRCGKVPSLPDEATSSRTHCDHCGNAFTVAEPIHAVPTEETGPGAEPVNYDLVQPAAIEVTGVADALPLSILKPTSLSPIRALLGATARDTSRLQGPSICLLALSAADLFMTFTLLQASHAFYESNPIASWIFDRWDMAGMVLFKFAMIGGAIAMGEIIERKRPGWGRFVLYVGCAGAVYAIWQGFQLYLGTIP